VVKKAKKGGLGKGKKKSGASENQESEK